MKTATMDFGVQYADIGVRYAEFRARVPSMPGQQSGRGSQNALVPTGAAGVFQLRGSVLCVARDSERGLMLADSGARKKAVLMTGDGQVFDLYSENHKKGGISMDQTGKKTVSGPMSSGLGSGVVDSNRFYSMLLDAKSANVTVSENMHDIAEKLLTGEKDNAKLALDQLWTLKKALTDAGADDTIEDLISYYQNKIDALREREEAIKKVSKETRALIEDKKMKDEELALIKSQIGGCTRDLKELNSKLEQLRKRETELTVAERRLREEITANESQIVGGLYDIILRRPDVDPGHAAEDRGDDALDLVKPPTPAPKKSPTLSAAARAFEYYYDDDGQPIDPIDAPPAAVPIAKKEREPETINKEEEAAQPPMAARKTTKMEVFAIEPVVYPKSVVRMGGKVIGEYYHDGNVVTKEERHYIYNSRFIAERLGVGIGFIKNKFNQEVHAELIKIAEDAASRVRENSRFHFEVSTNEILNDKNLKQLISDLRRRVWDDAERFAARLSAKIEALGSNYEAMLQEQMERCAETD